MDPSRVPRGTERDTDRGRRGTRGGGPDRPLEPKVGPDSKTDDPT